jgi:hypothetical protein
MKVPALKEKAGAYEIRQTDETIYGGIIISRKNRGVGFVGDAKENRYIFEFEDGMFSKSVKIFFNSKDNQIGKVDLGFTDSGTLKFADKTYEWQVLGSSKIWLDSDKNSVMFFDLENNSDKSPNILTIENLDAKTKDLLMLCGWYLLVVEWRNGLTNANLAGMPVKTEDFKAENKTEADIRFQKNWFDILVDAVDVLTD